MTQITSKLSAMAPASQLVRSLSALVLETDTMVDSGDAFIHRVPIDEGHALPHAMFRLDQHHQPESAQDECVSDHQPTTRGTWTFNCAPRRHHNISWVCRERMPNAASICIGIVEPSTRTYGAVIGGSILSSRPISL